MKDEFFTLEDIVRMEKRREWYTAMLEFGFVTVITLLVIVLSAM